MQYAEVQRGNTYTKSPKSLLLHKKGPSITIKDQAKANTKFRKFHKKCKKLQNSMPGIELTVP